MNDSVPLKEYIEARIADIDLRNLQRFESQEKAVQAALLAAKEAVIKAEIAAEKRFDSVNEFRGQLSDQVATFLPRNEFSVQQKALDDKVNTLANRLDRTEGRTKGLNDGWGYVVGALGIIGMIITLVLKLK